MRFFRDFIEAMQRDFVPYIYVGIRLLLVTGIKYGRTEGILEIVIICYHPKTSCSPHIYLSFPFHQRDSRRRSSWSSTPGPATSSMSLSIKKEKVTDGGSYFLPSRRCHHDRWTRFLVPSSGRFFWGQLPAARGKIRRRITVIPTCVRRDATARLRRRVLAMTCSLWDGKEKVRKPVGVPKCRQLLLLRRACCYG
jgi:hypothetical protein